MTEELGLHHKPIT